MVKKILDSVGEPQFYIADSYSASVWQFFERNNQEQDDLLSSSSLMRKARWPPSHLFCGLFWPLGLQGKAAPLTVLLSMCALSDKEYSELNQDCPKCLLSERMKHFKSSFIRSNLQFMYLKNLKDRFFMYILQFIGLCLTVQIQR